MPDHVAHADFDSAEYGVAEVIGFMKGKSSIWDRAECRAKGEEFHGAQTSWARGYFVSTVGRDEETIRAYIRNQELQDRNWISFP